MVGVDLDPPPLLWRDRTFLVDCLQDTRDGRACETEEEDLLTWLQRLTRNLGAFEDRDGRLSRTRLAGHKLVADGPEDFFLRLGQVDHGIPA